MRMQFLELSSQWRKFITDLAGEINFRGRKIIIEGRRCLRVLVAFLGLEIYEFCRSSSGKKGGEGDSYFGALGLFL